MITVTAPYRYDYQTQAELDWILTLLPVNANPVIDKIAKTVTYQAVQVVEMPK